MEMSQQSNVVIKDPVLLNEGVAGGQKYYQPIVNGVPGSGEGIDHERHIKRDTLENIFSIVAVLGDLTTILVGLGLAIRFRFQSVLVPSYIREVPALTVHNGYKLMALASLIVIWGLLRRDLYTYKVLLRPFKSIGKFAAAFAICLLTFIAISIAVRTDPPISRRFIAGSISLICLSVYAWRIILSRIMQIPSLAGSFRRRLVVIGGGSQTIRIQKELEENPDFQFVGWLQAIRPNRISDLDKYRLGSLHELGNVLHQNRIDVAVLTESESLQHEGVLAVAKVCESEHVQFRIVPHFFEILVSSVRPENIGGIQVLGVDALPLNGQRNRIIKRFIDVTGSVIGLMLSVPLIVIFGALVYLESPGPIFYTQVRMGRNGRLFRMIKIRSMKLNAEACGKVQWAKANDPRRLRIGTFLRKWNIDEVPQFWNVLKGEMSLVGPRPERPELVARFKSTVPHYQVRHTCHPGMTGWAQINGLRGNTNLEDRICFDIWYIESWNLLLDIKIMLLTFLRRENAY
jgi:exopolysaccharide biosynthesis polyprenyl glycosylphosphotransferase